MLLGPEHCCVFIQDRGINNLANHNTKLWVDQTKWTGFLARKGLKNVSFNGTMVNNFLAPIIIITTYM